MNHAVSNEALWTASASTARIECGEVSASIDPSAPMRGLTQLAWRGGGTVSEFAERLLAVESPAGPLDQAADAYARGADFVATQPGTTSFPFRSQAYWSGFALEGGGVALTVTVSLQTNLLDTRPELRVISRLSDSFAAPRSVAGGVALAQSEQGFAVALAPHPSDAQDAESVVDGATHTLRLRPPFLEKGVIRRMRVAAFLLPVASASERIDAALAEFGERPVPLTT